MELVKNQIEFQPELLVKSQIEFQPELLLIEANLDNILSKISFIDFITIISRFPDVYDSVQKLQSYWRQYYINQNYRIFQGKTYYRNKDLINNRVEYDKKINWFQQCCIQTNNYILNSTNNVKSSFKWSVWNGNILEKLSEGQSIYEDYPHSLEENFSNMRLSRLHNIKKMFCGNFYSYVEEVEEEDEGPDMIAIKKLELLIVILFEDATLQIYNKRNKHTYTLLDNVSNIYKLYSDQDDPFNMMLLAQTYTNEYYIIIIIGNIKARSYIKKIIFEDTINEKDIVLSNNMKGYPDMIFEYGSYYQYTFVYKDVFDNVFRCIISTEYEDIGNIVNNDDIHLHISKFFDTLIFDSKDIDYDDEYSNREVVFPSSFEESDIPHLKPEFLIEEKDIPYSEREITDEMIEFENGIDMDSERDIVMDKYDLGFKPNLLFYREIQLESYENFYFGTGNEISDYILHIYLSSNYKLHYLIKHRTEDESYRYNLSKHHPIIKHLKIKKVDILIPTYNIIYIIHSDGLIFLYPPSGDEMILSMVREINLNFSKAFGYSSDTDIPTAIAKLTSFSYVNFITNESSFHRTIDVNINKYPIHPDNANYKLFKVKDVMAVESVLPNPRQEYQIYFLDINKDVYTCPLEYREGRSPKYNSPNEDNRNYRYDLVYRNFKVIANNVNSMTHAEGERIVSFEVNVNRYVIVPYEYYLEYQLKEKLNRDIVFDTYILFTIYSSDYIFKCYRPVIKKE